MRRVTWCVSVLVALAFSIFSLPVKSLAADTEASLIEGAKKEGHLYIYHSWNAIGYGLRIKAFKQKYPFLTVESFRAPAPKLLLRLISEANFKKYIADVFDVRGYEISIAKEKGLLMKFNLANARHLPAEYSDPEGYYYGHSYAVQSVAYNTKLVSANNVPKNFEDLLNPKWKGKMFLDERDYEWFGNMLSIMGKEKGLEYMKKLSKQNIQFRMGKRLIANLLTAGEGQLFLTATGSTIEEYRAVGAPVRWLPFNPSMGQMDAIGITARTSSPNAAKLFANYITSQEGQEMMAQTSGVNPMRADAKFKYPELDVKNRGFKLFMSSLTTDYSKFDRQFREIFVTKQ